MELKGKKVLVFGAGKSGIGAADLLNAVGACPVLYDGKADLDKESVLHKISGNYELPIYAGELPKEVQESLDLVVLSPGVPTDLPIVKGFYDQGLPVWARLNWLIRRERVKFLQLPEQTEKLQQQLFLEKSCQMHVHLYLLLEILELRILPSHWR